MPELPSCAAGVPIFRALPAAALDDLSSALRHQRYPRGAMVARAGEPVDALIVVAAGRLKAVHTTAAGREQVVRTLGPGDFLGELALFAPARHDADLIAGTAAEVCLVPRRAMQALLQHHAALLPPLVEALARRLAEAEQTIAALGLRDTGQRLAALLLRLAAEGGGAELTGVRLRMPAPWAEMAARLGTTPESISRRLAQLADQGIVRQERGRAVVILDAARLRALADGSAPPAES